MNEKRNPIDKTGRANTHEVGVPGAAIGTESMSLQEIFGKEEIEVGTIDESTMKTAAGGDSSKE